MSNNTIFVLFSENPYGLPIKAFESIIDADTYYTQTKSSRENYYGNVTEVKFTLQIKSSIIYFLVHPNVSVCNTFIGSFQSIDDAYLHIIRFNPRYNKHRLFAVPLIPSIAENVEEFKEVDISGLKKQLSLIKQ